MKQLLLKLKLIFSFLYPFFITILFIVLGFIVIIKYHNEVNLLQAENASLHEQIKHKEQREQEIMDGTIADMFARLDSLGITSKNIEQVDIRNEQRLILREQRELLNNQRVLMIEQRSLKNSQDYMNALDLIKRLHPDTLLIDSLEKVLKIDTLKR